MFEVWFREYWDPGPVQVVRVASRRAGEELADRLAERWPESWCLVLRERELLIASELRVVGEWTKGTKCRPCSPAPHRH